MAHLTKLIFERAQPKRLGAQVITGPMLATLASEYVRAINEGAVPTISTAWQVCAATPSVRLHSSSLHPQKSCRRHVPSSEAPSHYTHSFAGTSSRTSS